MAFHIAVCDDSAADREYITNLTKHWAEKENHFIHISEFTSAENFLFSYEEQKDFDILLLDIEMENMDGVSLAKQLRKENETLQIVFITGYSDYISEGYEVAALHYLMKPVKEGKLFSVLNRAVTKLLKNERTLNLEISSEMIRIPFYQIRYLDVQKNYVTIHANEDYTIKKTLNELASTLDDRFHRAGRSAIVNLSYINRVTKTEIILSDGTKIPLPRGAYESINRAIINMG